MTRRLTEVAYLQLQPQLHWQEGQPPLGFKVARVTQKKPTSTVDGAIVVKIRLTVDSEAFENVPVVNIDIPLTAITPIDVMAEATA